MSAATQAEGRLDAGQMQRAEEQSQLLIDCLATGESVWQVWTSPLYIEVANSNVVVDRAVEDLTYRLALAESFDGLLAKLEERAVSFPSDLDATKLQNAATECWSCIQAVSRLIMAHTRFNSYPLDRISRLCHAFLDCSLWFVSWIIVMQELWDENIMMGQLKKCAITTSAVARLLHRHPAIRIDTHAKVLAWSTLPDYGPPAIEWISRKQILHNFVHFLITHYRLSGSECIGSVFSCTLALGVPSPSGITVNGYSGALDYTLGDSRQRLNSNNFPAYVRKLRESEVDVCLACGTFKRVTDGADLHYKICASCGVACYCSVQCQTAHWKSGGHQEACNKICLKKT